MDEAPLVARHWICLARTRLYRYQALPHQLEPGPRQVSEHHLRPELRPDPLDAARQLVRHRRALLPQPGTVGLHLHHPHAGCAPARLGLHGWVSAVRLLDRLAHRRHDGLWPDRRRRDVGGAAVAADGIQLICKARVTVRANISQLVGGAGEETILARVGEGIVSSIGSSKSHKEVLENPDRISKLVLERGLDAGTAYEILSIDIADIDIGKNIGAILQTDQAEADLKVAEAKAEERRAMAVAAEQEMIAKAQEARAKVILAEAEVPKAMAEAFRQGNLGIMDYYKFQNIQADTGMRESIADDKSKESGGKTDKGSKSE